MTSPTRTLAAAAVVAALVLGACGSDDEDGADASETTEQSADASMDTDTTEAEAGSTASADIVDTAVDAGSFETLVAAVQAAELEETLRSDGPFTVFAPTDDAFAALPEGTVDTLLQDPTGDLADILTYHVVEGAVMAADVVEMDGQQVTTVNGATATVNVADDGSVSLTDAAGNQVNVIETDIETSNGVIHVLDGVLMPA
ncbi:MAG TPA: fasciclin domain-containing protein [Acidimicrobiales bacterium]|nr:fasciclin domain-containing protein [Acidimicrobiales bacterium]